MAQNKVNMEEILNKLIDQFPEMLQGDKVRALTYLRQQPKTELTTQIIRMVALS